MARNGENNENSNVVLTLIHSSHWHAVTVNKWKSTL